MKIKLLIYSALILLSLNVYAQTEEVYKVIAKETCACMAGKNYDYATADRKEVEMTLGICMLESAQKNKLSLDVSDNTAMTTLGQKIGLLMISSCPDVFKAFVENDETAEEDETQYFTLTGTVRSIEEKDFLYVNVKDETSKESKFIWLYYFSGSDDFKSDPKKLIGKKVEITYIQLEVFQPKSKVYYNLNVISGLVMK